MYEQYLKTQSSPVLSLSTIKGIWYRKRFAWRVVSFNCPGGHDLDQRLAAH